MNITRDVTCLAEHCRLQERWIVFVRPYFINNVKSGIKEVSDIINPIKTPLRQLCFKTNNRYNLSSMDVSVFSDKKKIYVRSEDVNNRAFYLDDLMRKQES